MTVYVDDMRARLGRMVMCHMAADTLEELHDMAFQLGLKREWFQDKPTHPHYDISLGKRKLAISLGAKPVTMRDMLSIWKQHQPTPSK